MFDPFFINIKWMGLRSEILFTNEVGIFAVKFNKLLVSAAFYDFAVSSEKFDLRTVWIKVDEQQLKGPTSARVYLFYNSNYFLIPPIRPKILKLFTITSFDRA